VRVFCANAGSSSLKLALFEGEARVAHGSVERIGQDDAEIVHEGTRRRERVADHTAAVAALAAKFGGLSPDAVGHRFVHGGTAFADPVVIDDPVARRLADLAGLAPIHTPPALAVLASLRAQYPVPHVACFDTAFHASLPEVARRLPLPDELVAPGLCRYGFHGLSYEYVASALAPLPARVVVAHLGNGASLAALRDGRSIDTTMGFTPTGSIPMSTRSGDLDPGVVLWLLRDHSLSQVSEIVEKRSGLLALGGASDMRTLLARDDARARRAVAAFAYHVKKTIGAYFAALGGLDLLVFTGGIGERSPAVRAAICDGLAALGIALDPERNARGEEDVGAGPVAVRVVATDEDRVIARHVARILGR